MVKTEIKVKRELLDDINNFILYLNIFVDKINMSYGRKFAIDSWQVDTKDDDETDDVRTVELSLK